MVFEPKTQINISGVILSKRVKSAWDFHMNTYEIEHMQKETALWLFSFVIWDQLSFSIYI